MNTMKLSGPEIRRGENWRLSLKPNDPIHQQKLETQLVSAGKPDTTSSPEAFFDINLVQALASLT